MILKLRMAKDGLGLTAQVKSHTDPDIQYSVVRSEGGEYRCTCPHNFIRKVSCKHINEVMAEVYRQELRTEPSLYVLSLERWGGRSEGIVLARSAQEARNKFRARWGTSMKILQVIKSSAEVLVRSNFVQ